MPWPPPGSRMRLRTVRLTAKGAAPLTLVDVRAYPELPATFALVDDSGMCRSSTAQLSATDAAIKLQPGEEYLVTVILDSADGPWRRHALPVLCASVLLCCHAHDLEVVVAEPLSGVQDGVWNAGAGPNLHYAGLQCTWLGLPAEP